MTRDELARLQDRLFRSVVLALEHEVSDATDEDLTLVDVLCDRSAVEPLEELETRELHAYLRDAVHLLPERHRLVIVGYFLEGRTSQELARFLGVTESRVSQLRSEALAMLQGRHRGPVRRPGRLARPEHRPGRPPQGHLRRGHRRGQPVAEPPRPGRTDRHLTHRIPRLAPAPDDPGGQERPRTAPTSVGAVPRREPARDQGLAVGR